MSVACPRWLSGQRSVTGELDVGSPCLRKNLLLSLKYTLMIYIVIVMKKVIGFTCLESLSVGTSKGVFFFFLSSGSWMIMNRLLSFHVNVHV